jgi:hypothetical protein
LLAFKKYVGPTYKVDSEKQSPMNIFAGKMKHRHGDQEMDLF